MDNTNATNTTKSLTNVILYFAFPILILIYSIYRFRLHQHSSHIYVSRRTNSSSRSSDGGSIPDVKERMRLFNERKAALIAKARETYLKKHPDARSINE